MGRRCRDCFSIYLVVTPKVVPMFLEPFLLDSFLPLARIFVWFSEMAKEMGPSPMECVWFWVCHFVDRNSQQEEPGSEKQAPWLMVGLVRGAPISWSSQCSQGLATKQLQVGDFQEKLCQKVEENSPQVFEASCVVFNYIIKVLRTNYHDCE